MEQNQVLQTEVIDNEPDQNHVIFQNPWPHLDDYFKLSHQSKENNKVMYFQCQKCLPAKKIINGHVSSRHNLKSHYRRTHPTFSAQFENAIKAGPGRGKSYSSGSSSVCNSGTKAPKMLMKKIQHIIGIEFESDQNHLPFQNLWPHLESFFKFSHQSKENNKVMYFQCQKCLPSKKIINGHVSSLHNLKSHFRRAHPTFFAQFEEAIRAGSSRGKRHSSGSNSVCNSSINAFKMQTKKIQHHVGIEFGSDENYLPFQNLWPHLKGYFKFSHQSKENNKVIYFQCQKCLPAKKIINGHVSSLHNLKSHFRRTHPTFTTQFENAIKAGSSRGKRHYSGSNNSMCHLGVVDISMTLLQSTVDEKIVRLFVNNMLPFPVVESEEFSDLVRTLNPSMISMSCCTLGKQIDYEYLAIKESLINTFDRLRYLATTADCWTVHDRSFLGMTAHWIDQSTRARKHALLTCTHWIGCPSYDMITKSIVQVHEHFDVQDKVVRTITDNGTNFVKGVEHYCAQLGSLLDQRDLSKQVEAEPNNVDGTAEGDDDCAINIVTLGELLEKKSEEHPCLRAHMRCASHTFHLVASVDVGKYLLNQSGPEVTAFNALDKVVHGKVQAIFDVLGSSSQIGLAIEEAVRRRLVVPGNTRWHSMYDSIVVLNSILSVTMTKVEFNKTLACTEKLAPFTDLEISFLSEWAKVMSHVAIAFNTIQDERNAYLGTLLPIVAITITNLKEIRSSLTNCKPLVDALVEALSARFNPFFSDRDCQLAAAFHPKFRLHWLRKFNVDHVASVRIAMEVEVERELKDLDVNSNTSSSDSSLPEDIFSGWIAGGSHATVREKANRLVATWVEADGKDGLADTDFMGEKALINLFLKFNTPIPSSAAVERLFSLDSDILRPKGTRLNFEKLTFLKGNRHIVL